MPLHVAAGSGYYSDNFEPIDRTTLMPPFNTEYPSNGGTIGLLLTTSNSDLAPPSAVFGVTAAHVVFPSLTEYFHRTVVEARAIIDSFNESVPFAHFDLPPKNHTEADDSLDIAIVRLRDDRLNHISNIAYGDLVDIRDHRLRLYDCVDIVKVGKTTGATHGRLIHHHKKLGERIVVAVTAYPNGIFALPGDSGSALLWRDVKQRNALVPIAVLSMVQQGPNVAYGGCDLLRGLQKLSQKMLGRAEPPPLNDVKSWFKLWRCF